MSSSTEAVGYEVRLRLIVADDSSKPTPPFDHNAVDAVLRVWGEENRWSVGEKMSGRPGDARLRPNSAIVYKYFTGFDYCDPVVEIDRLVTHLENGGEAVRDLLKMYAGELSVVVRLYDMETNSAPPFHLPTAMLKRIAALELDVDLDLYVFPGLQPERLGSAAAT
jgi:hypothetical protein